MIGFFTRAARTAAANSGAPATLPPGESTSSTIVPTFGLSTAAASCCPSTSNEVPPLMSDKAFIRGAIMP